MSVELRDLACRYVAEWPQVKNLATFLHSEAAAKSYIPVAVDGVGVSRKDLAKLQPYRAEQSVPVWDRSNERGVPVSFIDVSFSIDRHFLVRGHVQAIGKRLEVFVMVEAEPASAVRILERLRVCRENREYYPCEETAWVVAVTFDLHDWQVSALHAHEVEVVRLGSAFDRWVEAKRAPAAEGKRPMVEL